MTNGSVHITSRSPSPPGDADFALYIDFEKGVGSPERVFRTADRMISALQKLDETLCGTIDSHIEPVMLLENLETGSIKAWLRNALESTEDQALKDIDWKPAVGKYLVRAKYAYIRWSNKDGGTLRDLAREIRTIASETDVRRFPDYAPPPLQELAYRAREIDAAKSHLSKNDRMQYIVPETDPIDFDLSVSWAPEELEDLSVKETVKFENMPMNLIVKKPDYLGNSKWDFRHGRKPISARIDHEEWLSDFQDRNVDVRPGDALRCMVTIEHSYGYDNELVRETFTVTEVQGVLQNNRADPGMFDDDA